LLSKKRNWNILTLVVPIFFKDIPIPFTNGEAKKADGEKNVFVGEPSFPLPESLLPLRLRCCRDLSWPL
jgi:hypothetical protein